MVELFDGEIRHERDNVYIRKGGITVYRKEHIQFIRSQIKQEIVRGHIVVDKYSSFEVKSIEDVRIADYIACNILGMVHD